MLPPSCDPGYALLGIDLGADYMFKAATSFGYDSIPPLDLPGTVSSYFPTAASFANNIPGLGYSSIGQENVRATALQDALGRRGGRQRRRRDDAAPHEFHHGAGREDPQALQGLGVEDALDRRRRPQRSSR